MALTDDTEALMLAYVYGELPASDALAFERRMDAATPEGAELRAEVEGLRASRALFGRDAQFGVTSGIDVPPAHLVDAIMNAEAIARPSALRQARLSADADRALSRAPEDKTFTAKLSRWLLGGGVAVGAAAALFVVVTRSNPEQLVEVSEASPRAEQAPAPSAPPFAGPLAEPPPESPAEPKPATSAEDPAAASAPAGAIASGTLDESGGGFAGLAATDDAKLEAHKGGADDGDMRSTKKVVVGGKADERFDARAQAVPDAVNKPEPSAPRDATPKSKPADATVEKRSAATREADVEKAAEKPAERKPERKSAKDQGEGRYAAGEAQSPTDEDDEDDALADRFSTVTANEKSKAKELAVKEGTKQEAAKKNAPAEERSRGAPVVTDKSDAPGSAATGLSAPVTSSPRWMAPPPPVVTTTPTAPMPAAKAPAKPSADAPFAYAPPPPPKVRADDASDAPLNVVSPDELKKRRAAGREKADVGKSSVGADAERARRLEQSNVALATADREAGAKRWLNALDQYANAEVIDRDRALGATPLVGQMRMLVELKRPVDAAKVARRLGRWDVKSYDVPAGLLFGAQVAEQIGDERLARELWTRLLDVPAEKARARAALDRLDGAKALRRSPSSAFDGEAESTAPAAASESSKD